MKLFGLAVIASTAFSFPLSHEKTSDNTTLLPRDGGRLCGSFQYSEQMAQDAFGDATRRLYYPGDFIQETRPDGSLSQWPHYFGNQAYDDGTGNFRNVPLPAACTAGNVLDLQEFPILQNGQEYTGGSPGPDRVVVARIAEGSNNVFAQCVLMTHTGAPVGQFIECV